MSCWFSHDWEWSGYSFRRCMRCGRVEEHVHLGSIHRPSFVWRTTTKAITHFAAIDKERAK